MHALVYTGTNKIDFREEKDPIANYRSLLYEKELLDEETENNLIEQIDKEVSNGMRWAENSPFPDPATLTEGVYA